MRKELARIVFAISILLLSLLILQESMRLPIGSFVAPGSGLFPIIVSSGFVILAIFAVIGEYRNNRAPRETLAYGKIWQMVLMSMVGVSAGASIDYFGYLITTFLTILIILLTVYHGRPAFAVGTAFGVTLLAVITFNFLGVGLPILPVWMR